VPGKASDLGGMPVAAEEHMSDEIPVKQVETAPAAKSSKAVLGLIVVNLAITGFVAFKVLTTPPAAAAAAGHGHGAETELIGQVVPLDSFVVNLDEPGTSRYLKVSFTAEISPGTEHILEKSKQLIRDTILSYLSGLHLKDTLGAEAKEKVRGDVLAKVTKLLGPDKVRRLLFQDFVVQ
jgi:flagellar FliL protein